MHDNDPDEHDINTIEEVIADRQRSRPPRDTYGRTGITREDINEMAEAAGSDTEVLHPGQMKFDSDGFPSGMTRSWITQDGVTKPVLRRADAERLGLTAEELSKVHVIN